MEETVLKLVVLGCGRVGSTIATDMDREGHDVTIMDINPDSFRRLSKSFSGKVIVGNGIDEDDLRRADLENIDAFVAVTNGDNRNIMSVQLAKVRFKVPKVIARIYDPNRASAYAEMGIHTICTTCIGAGLMEDVLMDKPLRKMEEYCQIAASSTALEENNG